MFGLGYAFADQIQSGIREVQQWVTVIAAVGVAIWLLVRYDKARRRAGLPVGPPVLDSDDVPLPVAEPRGAPTADRTTRVEERPSVTNPVPVGAAVADTGPLDRNPEAPDKIPAVDSPVQPPTPPTLRGHGPVMHHPLDAGQPQSSVESRS